MKLHHCIIAMLAAASAAVCGAALADGMPDPPADFFPGKYYEWKAQFYLKRKQYSAALDMFQLSGFWADKMSQYNAGVMLFNGIGIPKDRPRGVAWMRIAAEAHEELPVATYNAMLSELGDDERRQAFAIWRELDAKYGDKVSLPRALDRYVLDGHSMTNFGIPDADLRISEVGTYNVNVPAWKYMEAKKAEVDALIKEITGTVEVGSVRTLSVADDARRGASDKVIEPADATPPDAAERERQH